MVKVKRLVSIGIVLGVLAFPTSSFASTGSSANHQIQTYSSVYRFFSECFGNKGGSGNNGGNNSWNWNDKDDRNHDSDDSSDSYNIWQKWYCN